MWRAVLLWAPLLAHGEFIQLSAHFKILFFYKKKKKKKKATIRAHDLNLIP